MTTKKKNKTSLKNRNCNWSWNDLRECQKLWGGLCILHCSCEGGLRPPYKYGAKYISLPRVFDTPSSHSNFHPNSNSNSNLNSKLKNKKVFYVFILEFRLELELELGLKLEWLEGVSKTLRRLVYFVPYLYGGRSPPITTIQHTQASPEFSTLPQVIPTSIPVPFPI